MVIFIFGNYTLLKPQKPTVEVYQESTNLESGESHKLPEEAVETIEKDIYVDICGAVKNPGVIKVNEGARVIDAVEIAGGLLSSADRKRVNLARVLIDGEQIYIPEIGEEPWDHSGDIFSGESKSVQPGKVNINTASSTELQSLNGIGNVLAERIVQYRQEKGKFKRIEDLKNVSGIGEKKYEGIKDAIRVE